MNTFHWLLGNRAETGTVITEKNGYPRVAIGISSNHEIHTPLKFFDFLEIIRQMGWKPMYLWLLAWLQSRFLVIFDYLSSFLKPVATHSNISFSHWLLGETSD